MKRAGLAFEIVPPGPDELDAHLLPSCVPVLNAVSKAESVCMLNPDALTIGSDTVILFNGRVLGKPRSREHAVEILLSLSGETHVVTSGVCALCPDAAIRCVFSESSRVAFKRFGPDVAAEYAARVNTLDKAGAYALQEHGDMIIERVDGPLDNVVGLPVEKLLLALKACAF